MEKHFKYNAISVGQVFRSRKCGNYIVTYVKSSTDVGVKFLETGFSKENNAAIAYDNASEKEFGDRPNQKLLIENGYIKGEEND